MTDAFQYASAPDPSGSTALLIRALLGCRSPFERHCKFDIPVQTSSRFTKLLLSVKLRCPCVSAETGHFTCTSLALKQKGKEALRTNSQHLASLRTFGSRALGQLFSRLIFDQQQVNASYDALAGIVCCKMKCWEWTMAHCSGTKSSTYKQRFSLWAQSTSVAWTSAPSKVRPACPGRSRCADSQNFWDLARMPVRICTDAAMGRFARTSLALK